MATKSSGNVLFLILIAVALFAALSYAVTGSSRSGSQTISRDKAKIAAAEIVRYATQVEQAVTRLQVINGCNDTQISFERAPFDGSDTVYLNPNAPGDFRCHVFHPDGGGLPYEKYRATTGEQYFYFFSSNTCVPHVGSGDIGALCVSDAKALVLILGEGFSVDENICIAINDEMGIEGIPLDWGVAWSSGGGYPSQAKGTFSPYYNIYSGGYNFSGKRSGCFESQSLGTNAFYHVLLAR